jgi:hypothetical protein
MQYHQLRILCALRDKIEPYWSPGYGPGSRANDTRGFRIA